MTIQFSSETRGTERSPIFRILPWALYPHVSQTDMVSFQRTRVCNSVWIQVQGTISQILHALLMILCTCEVSLGPKSKNIYKQSLENIYLIYAYISLEIM
jgi:hypothetical protein